MKSTTHKLDRIFVKTMIATLFLFVGAFPAGVAHAYVLTVTKVSPGTVTGGSAPWSPEINCGATCSYNYPASPTTYVGLTATPPSPTAAAPRVQPGIFVGWSGACAGTGTNLTGYPPEYRCTVVMDVAKTVTAIFDTITANAGAGREITLPTNSVTISGASASDSDGSVASVSWTKTSGPSAATIANPNTLTPAFSNLVVGPYVFRLTATDNLGHTTSNEMCLVTKEAAIPNAPGALWAMGNNSNGMLGLGYTSTQQSTLPYAGLCNIQSPARVGADTWSSVSGGLANGVGIKSDGTLWTWGSNIFGELGIDYPLDHYSPIQPLPGTTWKSVSAMGHFTTTAIKSDGTLWTWGWNHDWALGRSVSTSVDSSPGTIAYRTPTQVGVATNWDSVSNGDTYSIGLRTDGTLWAGT